MFEFELDYSHSKGHLVLPTPEIRKWVAEMAKKDKLTEAMDEIRTEKAAHLKRVQELDDALRVLENLGRNGHNAPSLIAHNPKEFANAGIAEAAVIMMRRANSALHVREIMKGLQDGGYVFKTDNPLSSVAPVLYMSAKNRKHGIVSMGKNTYSLKEIEEKNPVQ